MPSEVDERQPAHGVWLEVPVVVLADNDEWLITYLPPRAPFDFPRGDWPTADRRHPWATRAAWSGHGCLMMQQPGEHVAVWHLWHGAARRFAGWYLNVQTAFTRTPGGFDTQDLELDLLLALTGEVTVKDAELLDQRAQEGRFSASLVSWIRRYGDGLIERWQREGPWWDTGWATWTPPAALDATFPP